MTETATLPASIILYEAEGPYAHPDLDYPYIDEVAAATARNLSVVASCAEVDYQPGDFTSYRLVLVPLHLLRHAPARVFDSGVTGSPHAVTGMKSAGSRDDQHGDEGYYDPDGYLVSWLDHGAYPFRLGGHRGTLSADYVAESLGTGSGVSAVSLAVLLRAVSYHLDLIGDAPALEAVV